MSDAGTIARFVARRGMDRRARAGSRAAQLSAALPQLAAALEARGAERVWLFGSLAWGDPHEGSDIDLAVEGLPADAFLRAQGELLRMAPCHVDLVRIEEAPAPLAARIRAHGRVLHG